MKKLRSSSVNWNKRTGKTFNASEKCELVRFICLKQSLNLCYKKTNDIDNKSFYPNRRQSIKKKFQKRKKTIRCN